MKAENLNREELIERIDNGIKSIGSRIEEIDDAGYRLEKDASSKFKEVMKNVPEDLNNMSDKELRTLYRDLLYINELKTSTLEGAEQAFTMFKDVEDMISQMSEEAQKKVWEIYNNLYDENKNVASSFYKYDVLREIATEIYKAKDENYNYDKLEENLMRIVELISGGRDINVHYEYQKLKHGNSKIIGPNFWDVLEDLPLI